ncbi:MAG: NADH-quinone oxidoreductase subunit J [Candidatus Latescibacterota bacterium]|nr:MAG: NADH-quinone oxidoreductase subunit J [Candidatus Latescibacterota bacterium]
MQLVAFYIFAALSVLGAILMVTRKNPLGGAVALVVSLASLAALFAMLHAEFVFILQILLYAGAIMVLIIFTIMLLNLSREELKEPPVGKVKGLFILAATVVGLVGFIRVLRLLPEGTEYVAPTFGNIEKVGTMMLTDYLYPFEIISVLLLVAIVGVVLLAKKII